MKPKVLVTRPNCWGTKYKGETIDVMYVPIGHPTHVLRKGEPAADNMGEVMTGVGEKLLKKAFADHKPDIFLYWTHFGNFSVKLLKMLRRVSPDTIFVHGNGNQVLGPEKVCWFIWKFRRQIDAVLTSTTDPKRLALIKKHCRLVDTLYTFGFDPDKFTAPEHPPSYDCFFGGGDSVRSGKRAGRFPFSRFRHDLITKINRKHKILVRGGGTWHLHDIDCKPGIMDSLPYFREMQRAKIVLGTYHDNLERRYSKRTVYGGASGRLFMTRYIPGMEKDFENGKHLVWFHTIEEAMDLISLYLRREDKREEIAAAGREHFIKHHSWEARLRDFEKLVPRLLALRKKR